VVMAVDTATAVDTMADTLREPVVVDTTVAVVGSTAVEASTAVAVADSTVVVVATAVAVTGNRLA